MGFQYVDGLIDGDDLLFSRAPRLTVPGITITQTILLSTASPTSAQGSEVRRRRQRVRGTGKGVLE